MRKKRRYAVFMGLIGLLLLGSLNPVNAVGDWADDFDDGDFDGWTEIGGNFTVTNGQLVVTTLKPGDTPAFINHPSNVTMGTWSFDIQIEDTEDPEYQWVYFMKDEPGYFTGVSISLEFWSNIMVIGRTSDASWDEFDRWTFPRSSFGQHHIDIIHNETNNFYVYVNGSLAIETIGLVPPLTYDYFSFGGTLESSFDNLIVTEFVEPMPTTTTQPETTPTTTTTTSTTTPPPVDGQDFLIWAAAGGSGVVIVLIIIFFVKKK